MVLAARIPVVVAAMLALAACGERVVETRNTRATSTGEPALANILVNGDFESGDPYFAPWVSHIHADPEAFSVALDHASARSGRSSLRIERLKDEPFASVVQRFRQRDLTHQRYLLKGWMRGERLVSPAYLHATFYAFGSPFGSAGGVDSGLDGTFDWTPLTLEVSLPERVDSVEFGFTATGDGIVWVDDLELLPVED